MRVSVGLVLLIVQSLVAALLVTAVESTNNQHFVQLTPTITFKETRQFIKSPEAAAAAAAVLSGPALESPKQQELPAQGSFSCPAVVQQEVATGGYSYPKPQQEAPAPASGGYSYPKPQKQLQLVQQEETKPVVVAQPPKAVQVIQSQPQLPLQAFAHFAQPNGQFTSEVQKLHQIKYVQPAPVRYDPAPTVHHYFNRAPVKVQYVQYPPVQFQKQVQYLEQRPVKYIPPAKIEVVEKPVVPPPVIYLPPASAPAAKVTVVQTEIVEKSPPPPPTNTYLPPRIEKLTPPPVNYLPPPPPPAAVTIVQKNVHYVQPKVNVVQNVSPVVQKQVQVQYVQPQVHHVQFVQQVDPLPQNQVQYVQPRPQPLVQYVQHVQQAQPIIQQAQPVVQQAYLQQPQVQYVQHVQHAQPVVQNVVKQTYEQPQVQYQQLQYVQETPVQAPVVQQQQIHYEQPRPVVQAVAPAPVTKVHYAPQNLAYDPALPANFIQHHTQILVQPPEQQVVKKYDDIVEQNLDVMRYADAPVHQYLAPQRAAQKIVTQLQSSPGAGLGVTANGKQNPLTFNYGYDSGVAKVSHSYFGSGW